jgi:hypothetical protein
MGEFGVHRMARDCDMWCAFVNVVTNSHTYMVFITNKSQLVISAHLYVILRPEQRTRKFTTWR